MSSVNEELSAPPKHRLSPFEVRNTDLVSRLLAATPPYLYNIPMVPHSYFFSEMLKSLVQSKAEAATRMSSAAPHRRSRKRTWTQGRAEHYTHKQEAAVGKSDSQEMPPPTWTPPKMSAVDRRSYDSKMLERPLELTMNKLPLNNNSISAKLNYTETQPSEGCSVRGSEIPYKTILNSPSTIISSDKTDIHSSSATQIPMMFPPLPNLTPPDTHSPSSSSSSTDLILPPPPPIWYPPLYPPPYGIDPMHFFIDLRVSGHIYDRKKPSKESPNFNMHQSTPMSSMGSSNIMNNIMDVNNGNVPIPTASTLSSLHHSDNLYSYSSLTKQSRHTSAFSVPTPSLSVNDPLNLTSSKYQKNSRYESKTERIAGKFDIKSMGFDSTPENKQSSNYVLKNLLKIYREARDTKYDHEGIDLTSPRQLETTEQEINVKEEEEQGKEDEKESDKQKRCKDLRALIGLELVVDYVNHNVKPKPSLSEESSTDMDSRCSSNNSAVEIVSVPDM